MLRSKWHIHSQLCTHAVIDVLDCQAFRRVVPPNAFSAIRENCSENHSLSSHRHPIIHNFTPNATQARPSHVDQLQMFNNLLPNLNPAHIPVLYPSGAKAPIQISNRCFPPISLPPVVSRLKSDHQWHQFKLYKINELKRSFSLIATNNADQP